MKKIVLVVIAVIICGELNFFWLYMYYLINSWNSPKVKWYLPHVMANFMSTWLDHSVQTVNQTLFLMFLSRCFLDDINI